MRHMFVYAFPRPSVTATIALLVNDPNRPNAVGVLIGTRGRKDGAYAGFECIPGGFLDAKVDMADVVEFSGDAVAFLEDYDEDLEASLVKPGETVRETAIREVLEETGLTITEDQLNLYWDHSDPNTDPRAHVVNLCYYVVLDPETAATAVAGDDLEKIEIKYFELFDLIPTMAFNHADLLKRALDKYFGAK